MKAAIRAVRSCRPFKERYTSYFTVFFFSIILTESYIGIIYFIYIIGNLHSKFLGLKLQSEFSTDLEFQSLGIEFSIHAGLNLNTRHWNFNSRD